ncbi:uncharacterized protein LOC120625406 isoform X1 [Pararge aegeria]|nr:uncharacterized protein LOC120625406 isoform X1 [Pararge aegeria]XP_039748394.1 uncharacterized protein LOC120625406 isoform X1 [Pararge aegeria]
MHCCVPFCKNTTDNSGKSDGIRFLDFPGKGFLRSAWLLALGMEARVQTHAVVCSRHFLREDLLSEERGGRLLRAGAVPTTIQVCSICLDTDSKMFSMSKYNLEDAYEHLTGHALCDGGNLKHILCFECAQRLKNFNKFRDKSLRARSLMLDLVEKHEVITIHHISQLSHARSSLKSNLAWRNLSEEPSGPIELEDSSDEQTDVKTESACSEPDQSEELGLESDLQVRRNSSDAHAEDKFNAATDESIPNDYIQDEDIPGEHIADKQLSDEHMPDEYIQEENILDDHIADKHIPDEQIVDEYIPEVHNPEEHIGDEYIQDEYIIDDHIQDENLPDEHIADEYIEVGYIPDQQILDAHSTNEYMGYTPLGEEDIPDEPITDDHVADEHIQGEDIVDGHNIPDDHTADEYFQDEDISGGKLSDEHHPNEDCAYGAGVTPLSDDINLPNGDLDEPAIKRSLDKESAQVSLAPLKHTECSVEYSSTLNNKEHPRTRFHTTLPQCTNRYPRRAERSSYTRSVSSASERTRHTKLLQRSVHKTSPRYSGRLALRAKRSNGGRNASSTVTSLATPEQDRSPTTPKTNNYSKNSNIIEGQKYICDLCQKEFQQKCVLVKHIMHHSKQKLHTCNICQYQSKYSGNLIKHVMTHTGEKPFSCRLCQYKCTKKCNLERHMRSHTGLKPYECKICKYKCTIKSNLMSHMRTHTGEKPYACKVCQYKCSQGSTLASHMRTHIIEKPYACELCEYKCAKRSNLTRHVKSHPGFEPYACKICQYRGSKISNLVSHMRTHSRKLVVGKLENSYIV